MARRQGLLLPWPAEAHAILEKINILQHLYLLCNLLLAFAARPAMSITCSPRVTMPRQGGAVWASRETGEAEALACVIGLCVSAEYRLAATDAWGTPALDILQDTCLQIGSEIGRAHV